jgi:hypothetical protein
VDDQPVQQTGKEGGGDVNISLQQVLPLEFRHPNEIIKLLPHGSGIDDSWDYEEYHNGNLRFFNSYHMMDEYGSYTHWVPFSLKLRPCLKTICYPLKGPCEGRVAFTDVCGDILMDVYCRDADLRSYLYDTLWCGDLADMVIRPVRSRISYKMLEPQQEEALLAAEQRWKQPGPLAIAVWTALGDTDRLSVPYPSAQYDINVKAAADILKALHKVRASHGTV